MTPRGIKAKYLWLILPIFILIILRFYEINIDPPPYFPYSSRGLLTDPYYITNFAHNKILFGEWDVFNYPRWISFKYSLSSLMTYVVFSIGGVSRTTANISAAILNIFGLVFFLFGQSKISKRAFIITAVILFTNMIMFVFGRYPLLENGLILFCGLLYYLFIKYHDRPISPIITGIVIAVAAISGKIFGLVLVAPVIAHYLIFDKTGKAKSIGIFVISLIISFAVIVLAVYRENSISYFEY